MIESLIDVRIIDVRIIDVEISDVRIMHVGIIDVGIIDVGIIDVGITTKWNVWKAIVWDIVLPCGIHEHASICKFRQVSASEMTSFNHGMQTYSMICDWLGRSR